MGAGHVAPHELVAVEPLLVGTRAALEQMAEVELVARARREEHPVAERQEERMAHHVDREGARDAGDTTDLLRARAVERLDHRVEQLFVGIGGGDRGLDLVVDLRDDVEREELLDDHGAVAVECAVDIIDVGVGVEALDRGRGRGHRPSTVAPSPMTCVSRPSW